MPKLTGKQRDFLLMFLGALSGVELSQGLNALVQMTRADPVVTMICWFVVAAATMYLGWLTIRT